MSCHGYEGVMPVSCTPLQVKCYQVFIGAFFFAIPMFFNVTDTRHSKNVKRSPHVKNASSFFLRKSSALLNGIHSSKTISGSASSYLNYFEI